jgi:hypothetical protein
VGGKQPWQGEGESETGIEVSSGEIKDSMVQRRRWSAQEKGEKWQRRCENDLGLGLNHFLLADARRRGSNAPLYFV